MKKTNENKSGENYYMRLSYLKDDNKLTYITIDPKFTNRGDVIAKAFTRLFQSVMLTEDDYNPHNVKVYFTDTEEE